MPEIVCEGGLCRLVEETNEVVTATAGAAGNLAMGYMSAPEFLNFLSGGGEMTVIAQGPTVTLNLAVVALAFLGGLAMNLTPCVLPLVPVNLAIVGRSWKRGLAYGAGIALAYGLLGLAAAFGSLAFGVIQSSVWFNVAVSAVFVALGLALCGVWHLDFSRHRFRAGAFLMGVMSAVLAGACVAPVLIAQLTLTADLYARGELLAAGIPFVFGLGMAAPWPLLGAGLNVLPKPGRWMVWVNRLMALFVFALAVHYALLAWNTGFGSSKSELDSQVADVSIVPSELPASLATAKRPVLVDCWASWCKNCAAMDRVLESPEVKAALKDYTVIRVRAEDLDELRRQPGFESVRGLPAFVTFEK